MWHQEDRFLFVPDRLRLSPMPTRIRAAIESSEKRVFATAIDWPGWSRSGRTEADALDALLSAAMRFTPVAKKAKVVFDPPRDSNSFNITERIQGGSGTDFGVPSEALVDDGKPMSGAELQRWSALLEAAWATFDAAARKAVGHELRKGPRGGGRDLDKMIGHVMEAEEAYLHQLGRRRPKGPFADVSARMAIIRDLALEALAARAEGKPIDEPNQVHRPWSPRYFVRRSAWHALDHAWEIEDRAI